MMSEHTNPTAEAPPTPGLQQKNLLSIAQVARRWSVNYETVRRWCDKGAIAHMRLGPKGDVIRIPEAEVERHERMEGGPTADANSPAVTTLTD